MAKTKVGKQIPTKSIVKPYKKTDGQNAIDLYKTTGRDTMEWQELLQFDMLARNKDGLWTHTKFGYSVPRRNGKNEVVAIRELHGLVNLKEKILHTAHRTTTSHSAWERLCSLLSDAGIEYRSYKQFGFESIFVEDGGVINFRTRSSKGGLGEGYDLLVIDEAQEYTDDQESALKYVVTDSKNGQTVMCGTPPTAVSSGTVFTEYRKNTLNGDGENAGWAEWSIDEMSDPHEKKLWYQANPSLGIIFHERDILDEIGRDTVDFNIQRLGLWIGYNQKSAISEAEWMDLSVEELPELKGKLYVGIKFGNDGANVAVGIAVKTTSNKTFVEAVDCQSIQNGMGWLLRFLKAADIAKIVIDGANGQDLLAKEMKDSKIKPTPILPKVKEIIMANAQFEQGVFQKTICHKAQPSLVQIVSTCEKRNIGSNGGFGYKSQKAEVEVALMDSVILAHWICTTSRERRKQKVRV